MRLHLQCFSTSSVQQQQQQRRSIQSCAAVCSGNVLCMQVFGNSPDETAYFRIALNREAVPDALLAIQPAMLAYQLEQPVQVRPAL